MSRFPANRVISLTRCLSPKLGCGSAGASPVGYAWTNELDLAFETLAPLAKIPNGIYYGQFKRDPWKPLQQDPRYEKMLAELAPSD